VQDSRRAEGRSRSRSATLEAPCPAADATARISGRAKILSAFSAVYFVWGCTYLAIRYAVQTIPPFLTAGLRFLVAGVVLYGFARVRGSASPSRRHWASAAILAVLLQVGGSGALSWAEQRVPSGLAALLSATIPIWMVLLDRLHKGGTKIGGQVLGGMAIASVGLALLVGPARIWGSTRVDLAGAGIVVFSSFSWALGSVISSRLAMPASPFLGAAMEMVLGGALLLLLGVLAGEPRQFHLSAVAARSVWAVAYLIFASLVGFSSYIWLLRSVSTARVSTYAFVNPAVAVFAGWLAAGEVLMAREVFATVTVVAGVALIITHQPAPAAVGFDAGLPQTNPAVPNTAEEARGTSSKHSF